MAASSLWSGGPPLRRAFTDQLRRAHSRITDGPWHAELHGGSVIFVANNGGNGRLASVFNLTNCVINPGILFVPFAFRQCGWSTILVFMVIGVVATWTAVLVTRCLEQAARVVPEKDRGEEPLGWPLIGQAIAGSRGKAVVKVVTLLVPYAGTLSYLVLNGKILQILFPELKRFKLIAASGFVAFVSLHIPSKFLQYFSLLGIVATVMVAGSVAAAGLKKMPVVSGHQVLSMTELPEAASTIMFCFESHAVVSSIYMTMAEPARESFWRVSASSFSIAGLVYISVGAIAYIFFASQVEHNVTENITDLGIIRKLLAGIIATKLQASFPLLCTPLVRAAERGFTWAKGRPLDVSARMLSRAAVVTFTTLIAMELHDLNHADCIVVKLTGSICATSTAVIFPTLFYAKLYKHQLAVWECILLGITCTGGLFLLVAGTQSAVEDFRIVVQDLR